MLKIENYKVKGKCSSTYICVYMCVRVDVLISSLKEEKKPLKFLSIMSGSKYLLNVTPDIKSVERNAVK